MLLLFLKPRNTICANYNNTKVYCLNRMSEADVTPKEKSRLRRAKERLAALTEGTRALAIASLVFSIIILVIYLIPVGFIMATPDSPAQFRSAFFLFMGALAMCGISIYIDEEVFDYTVFLVTFIFLTIIPVVIGAVFELRRIAYCTGVATPSVTPLENDICINWPGQAYLIPVSSALFLLLTVILGLLVYYWFRRLNMKLTAKSIVMGRSIRDDLKKATENRIRDALASYARLTCMFVSAFMFVGLLVVLIAQLIYPSAAAFYRATFLYPTALLVASEAAFIGTTPRGWLWVGLVLAIFSSISTIWGLVYEWQRVINCRDGAPVGTTENQICSQEPGLSYIVPVVLFVSAIFSLISVIALLAGVIGEYCYPSSKSKKSKESQS